MTATWNTITPANVTGFGGMGVDGGSGGLQTGVATAAATATPASRPPVWSPENPLFIFGVLAAVTVGLFAVSVHVKSGPAKASLEL